jgi:hypothetical protein
MQPSFLAVDGGTPPVAQSKAAMPPCRMDDHANWRSHYQTGVFFRRGLRSAVEALSEVEPETGGRVSQQAAHLRRAIIRAADRSIVLTPVVRVSDRTYRRYIPPQPYLLRSARSTEIQWLPVYFPAAMSVRTMKPVHGFGPGRSFSDWPSTTTRNLRTPG